MSKRNYLRLGRREAMGTDDPPEYVPESEADENRRRVRDWLRDREDEWDFDTEATA